MTNHTIAVAALHPNDKEIWRVHGEQRWADEGSIVVSPITPTDHA